MFGNTLQIVQVDSGLQDLRPHASLSITPPASADLSDEACDALKRPLLRFLLRTTVASSNEASSVLKYYRVSDFGGSQATTSVWLDGRGRGLKT